MKDDEAIAVMRTFEQYYNDGQGPVYEGLDRIHTTNSLFTKMVFSYLKSINGDPKEYIAETIKILSRSYRKLPDVAILEQARQVIRSRNLDRVPEYLGLEYTLSEEERQAGLEVLSNVLKKLKEKTVPKVGRNG